jgi:hypothetical protein
MLRPYKIGMLPIHRGFYIKSVSNSLLEIACRFPTNQNKKPMRFISPKTDFAFKRIFGSSEHPEILISFLNAMLYDGEPIIQDIEIIKVDLLYEKFSQFR